MDEKQFEQQLRDNAAKFQQEGRSADEIQQWVTRQWQRWNEHQAQQQQPQPQGQQQAIAEPGAPMSQEAMNASQVAPQPQPQEKTVSEKADEEIKKRKRREAGIPEWVDDSPFIEGMYATITNTLPQAWKGINVAGHGARMRNAQNEIDRLTKLRDEGYAEAMISQDAPGGIKGKKMSIDDAITVLNETQIKDKVELLDAAGDIKTLREQSQLFDNPEIFDEDGITWSDLKGMAGRQLPQVAFSALTFGTGAFGQEYGHSYVDNLYAIAAQKYGTEEPTNEQLMEIINNGEDERGIALAAGAVSGSLEFIGAAQIVKPLFRSEAGKALLKGTAKAVLGRLGANAGKQALKGGLTEGLTEGMQGVTQDIARGYATNTDYEFDAKKTAEEIGQGMIVGAMFGGLGGAKQTRTEYKQYIDGKGNKKNLDSQNSKDFDTTEDTERKQKFENDYVTTSEMQKSAKEAEEIARNPNMETDEKLGYETQHTTPEDKLAQELQEDQEHYTALNDDVLIGAPTDALSAWSQAISDARAYTQMAEEAGDIETQQLYENKAKEKNAEVRSQKDKAIAENPNLPAKTKTIKQAKELLKGNLDEDQTAELQQTIEENSKAVVERKDELNQGAPLKNTDKLAIKKGDLFVTHDNSGNIIYEVDERIVPHDAKGKGYQGTITPDQLPQVERVINEQGGVIVDSPRVFQNEEGQHLVQPASGGKFTKPRRIYESQPQSYEQYQDRDVINPIPKDEQPKVASPPKGYKSKESAGGQGIWFEGDSQKGYKLFTVDPKSGQVVQYKPSVEGGFVNDYTLSKSEQLFEVPSKKGVEYARELGTLFGERYVEETGEVDTARAAEILEAGRKARTRFTPESPTSTNKKFEGIEEIFDDYNKLRGMMWAAGTVREKGAPISEQYKNMNNTLKSLRDVVNAEKELQEIINSEEANPKTIRTAETKVQEAIEKAQEADRRGIAQLFDLPVMDQSRTSVKGEKAYEGAYSSYVKELQSSKTRSFNPVSQITMDDIKSFMKPKGKMSAAAMAEKLGPYIMGKASLHNYNVTNMDNLAEANAQAIEYLDQLKKGKGKEKRIATEIKDALAGKANEERTEFAKSQLISSGISNPTQGQINERIALNAILAGVSGKVKNAVKMSNASQSSFGLTAEDMKIRAAANAVRAKILAETGMSPSIDQIAEIMVNDGVPASIQGGDVINKNIMDPIKIKDAKVHPVAVRQAKDPFSDYTVDELAEYIDRIENQTFKNENAQTGNALPTTETQAAQKEYQNAVNQEITNYGFAIKALMNNKALESVRAEGREIGYEQALFNYLRNKNKKSIEQLATAYAVLQHDSVGKKWQPSHSSELQKTEGPSQFVIEPTGVWQGVKEEERVTPRVNLKRSEAARETILDSAENFKQDFDGLLAITERFEEFKDKPFRQWTIRKKGETINPVEQTGYNMLIDLADQMRMMDVQDNKFKSGYGADAKAALTAKQQQWIKDLRKTFVAGTPTGKTKPKGPMRDINFFTVKQDEGKAYPSQGETMTQEELKEYKESMKPDPAPVVEAMNEAKKSPKIRPDMQKAAAEYKVANTPAKKKAAEKQIKIVKKAKPKIEAAKARKIKQIARLLNNKFRYKTNSKYKQNMLTGEARNILDNLKRTFADTQGELSLEQLDKFGGKVAEIIKLGKQQQREFRGKTKQDRFGAIKDDTKTLLDGMKVQEYNPQDVDALAKKAVTFKERLAKRGIAGVLADALSPSSNDDFYGLMSRLVADSKDPQASKTIEDALIEPLTQANHDFLDGKANLLNKYANLMKDNNVEKKINESSGISVGEQDLTNSQAVMLFNYMKNRRLHNQLVKGLSPGGNVKQSFAKMKEIVNHVNGDADLLNVANGMVKIFADEKTSINEALKANLSEELLEEQYNESRAEALKNKPGEQTELSYDILELINGPGSTSVRTIAPYSPMFAEGGTDLKLEESIEGKDGNWYSAMDARLSTPNYQGNVKIRGNDLMASVQNYADGVNRTRAFLSFAKNANAVFNGENMQRMEVNLGKPWVDATRNSLRRIITGRTDSSRMDPESARMHRYLTRSVGNIMFFNPRSAILQMVSIPNFIMQDPKAYFQGLSSGALSDAVADISESGFMQQRRMGGTDVVTDAMFKQRGKDNSVAMIDRLGQKGYWLTQLGDKAAIAYGGAPLYAQLKKKYGKEEAMKRFTRIANEAQQSTSQDRLGQVQTGTTGRYLLAFTNATQQFNRIMSKSLREMQNGKDLMGNATKISYILGAQFALFSFLQKAMANAFFQGEEDDEKDPEKIKSYFTGLFDTIATSSGIAGAMLSTLVNVLAKIPDLREDGAWKPGSDKKVIQEVLSISPSIASKIRSIERATGKKLWKQSDGPVEFSEGFQRGASGIQAISGIPTERMVRLLEQMNDLGAEDLNTIHKILRVLGWSRYDLQAYAKQPNDTAFGKRQFSKGFGESPFKKVKEVKDGDPNVLARANKDGSIEINPNLKGEERKKVMKHEQEHQKQMKSGRLSYTDNSLTWKGKKYDRKGGKIYYQGKWRPEGDKSFPWEQEADHAEVK